MCPDEQKLDQEDRKFNLIMEFRLLKQSVNDWIKNHKIEAENRHQDTINNIKLLAHAQQLTADEVIKIKINCAENISFYDELKTKANKEEKAKIWKADKATVWLIALGGWSVAIATFLFKK